VGDNGAGSDTTVNGGVGRSNSITGGAVTYAAGGKGTGTTVLGQAGVSNTGNGGNAGGGSPDGNAGKGGSGVVIIRYVTLDFGVCTSDGILNVDYTISIDGLYTVFKWITLGNHTFTVLLTSGGGTGTSGSMTTNTLFWGS
jgi:hypothetical protein